MSSISGLDTLSSSQVQTSQTGTTTLGKDDFLKLLVAQLKAQDPLNPMDPTEFTTQLAQFTSLEELTNVNTNLGNLLTKQATANNSLAVDFLGKTIEASGNSVDLKNGVADSIAFSLDQSAAAVTVNVHDSSGNLVKTINAGSFAAGENSVKWDGTDNNGKILSDGEYTFTIQPIDATGNTVSSTSYIQGEVTGVLYNSGTTYLKVGNQEITLDKVIKLTEN
jgi:flagellar basal-body rod modification protein FlgD